VLLQLIHIRRVLTATATTAIYTLSLHDALPICGLPSEVRVTICSPSPGSPLGPWMLASLVHPMSHQPVDITGRDVEVEVSGLLRSEEHTSELQSRENLVCRLLLEKKKR